MNSRNLRPGRHQAVAPDPSRYPVKNCPTELTRRQLGQVRWLRSRRQTCQTPFSVVGDSEVRSCKLDCLSRREDGGTQGSQYLLDYVGSQRTVGWSLLCLVEVQ